MFSDFKRLRKLTLLPCTPTRSETWWGGEKEQHDNQQEGRRVRISNIRGGHQFVFYSSRMKVCMRSYRHHFPIKRSCSVENNTGPALSLHLLFPIGAQCTVLPRRRHVICKNPGKTRQTLVKLNNSFVSCGVQHPDSVSI